jgi:protein-disulfide isomerase
MRHSALLTCAAFGLFLTACSSSAQPARQMSPDEVVAKVGSVSITLGEVDAKALQQSVANFGGARLIQALYMARRAALDDIIAERLVEAEAKAQGIEPAALVEREITSKVTAPTDKDIEFWYQTNPDRVQGRPLDQLREAIRAFLSTTRSEEVRTAFLDSLKARTTIVTSLEPPRQQVATAGHASRGPHDAKVEIVEFSDFQCPFCQQAYPTVQRILSSYGDRIKFVYRHYPLPNHPNAFPAAEAAACADAQGKFWEFHDRLFANSSQLSDDALKQHAAALGLDTAAFSSCLDDHQMKAKVEKDFQDGEMAGVTGTPAFFINGRPLEGAQPFELFKRDIDEELALKR